jgi:hypothetical protein
MCSQCSFSIHGDLDNNIVPIWHDESILNRYVVDKNPLVLSCGFLYPEEMIITRFRREKKIVQLDKNKRKYGGKDYLRGITDMKIPLYITYIAALKKMIEKY